MQAASACCTASMHQLHKHAAPMRSRRPSSFSTNLRSDPAHPCPALSALIRPSAHPTLPQPSLAAGAARRAGLCLRLLPLPRCGAAAAGRCFGAVLPVARFRGGAQVGPAGAAASVASCCLCVQSACVGGPGLLGCRPIRVPGSVHVLSAARLTLQPHHSQGEALQRHHAGHPSGHGW